MVLTATTVGGYQRSLPPDRRVAMARVCSIIRRAARGVRESMRYGLAFYELEGPLFALELSDDRMTLFVAEPSVLEKNTPNLKGIIKERSAIEFTDLNRIPLDALEKIVRESVLLRRARVKESDPPTQAELLKLWKINEEDAQTLPPIVRIPMGKEEEKPEEEKQQVEEKTEPTVILRAPTFKDPAMTATSRPKRVPPAASATPKKTTIRKSTRTAKTTKAAEDGEAPKPKTRRTRKTTAEK